MLLASITAYLTYGASTNLSRMLQLLLPLLPRATWTRTRSARMLQLPHLADASRPPADLRDSIPHPWLLRCSVLVIAGPNHPILRPLPIDDLRRLCLERAHNDLHLAAVPVPDFCSSVRRGYSNSEHQHRRPCSRVRRGYSNSGPQHCFASKSLSLSPSMRIRLSIHE